MKAIQRKKSHSTNEQYDQTRLQLLGDALIDNLDALVNHFNLDLRETNKMMVGPCPIHGGDRKDAFNLFQTGETIKGNWYCRTKSCEKVFVSSPIGLIRGLLSRHELKWEDRGDEIISFKRAVEWSEKFLNTDINSFSADSMSVEQGRFVMVSKIHGYKRPISKSKITRDLVRNSLTMPSNYFIDRGFSAKVLDDYDVGICLDPSKRMYSRSVVPIYDDEGRYMVGCTGRSLYEKCPKCTAYHNPKSPCPPMDDVWKYSKWKHSPDFDADEYLYNFWKARYTIEKSTVAIIVESPGNCWRAIEAGYTNTVGTFGAKLSAGQKILLDSSGAMTLIILTDGDEAGKVARENIVSQCKDIYNTITPPLPEGKDLADLSVDEVKAIIEPIMKKYGA